MGQLNLCKHCKLFKPVNAVNVIILTLGYSLNIVWVLLFLYLMYITDYIIYEVFIGKSGMNNEQNSLIVGRCTINA